MIPSIKNIAPNTRLADMTPVRSHPIVQNGLMLHLDAGNTGSYSGSGSTWYDLSGNGFNATLVGSPVYGYNAINKGYLTFASGKYATLPANIFSPTSEPITIEAWVRPQVLDLMQPIYMSEGSASAANIGMVMNTSNKFNLAIGTSATQLHQMIATTNTWYHVIVAREKGQAYSTFYYFSKTTVNCTASTNMYLNNSSSVTLGTPRIAGDASGSNYFGGDIAVLRIYNRALLPAEMYQNFLYERDRFGVL